MPAGRRWRAGPRLSARVRGRACAPFWAGLCCAEDLLSGCARVTGTRAAVSVVGDGIHAVATFWEICWGPGNLK